MPLADFLIGHTLANYRIDRLLGRGGMASVYYGFDSQLQRPAAIKVIDERHNGDTVYSTRFVREARAMASWRHPNIPQIYQAGVESGTYYYAMEYIHGMNLEELLRQSTDKGELLSFEDVLRYGRAIAEALDYAHQNGAIHRDVKPSNVLISEDGRILLTDFGLVLEIDKGTRGEAFGSPFYIAPEQARSSAAAVPQSDLYALGVILYEMIVGRLPFEDESSASLAIKHITLAPPAPRLLNPDLSPEVEAVLLKALRKTPQERYQTGKDLMAALETAIGGHFPGVRNQHPLVPTLATLPFLPIEPKNQARPTNLEPGATADQPPGDDLALLSPEIPNQGKNLPGLSKQPGVSTPHKKYLLTAAVTVSLLAIFCVFLFGSVWLFGRLKGLFPGSAIIPSPTTSRLTQIAATANAAIDPATAAAPKPTPTAVVTKYHLTASLQKTDSLLVINRGIVDVPLAQLRFGPEKGGLLGKEWGVDVLQPGQCVTVLKKEGRSEAPADVQCKLVGKHLTRSGPSKFWDSAFDVNFQNVWVASCNLENDICDIQFTNPPH